MASNAKRPGFMLYHDDCRRLRVLTLEQKGKLLDALFEYSDGGTVSEFDDPVLWVLFDAMAEKITRDGEKYERKSSAARHSAEARWNNVQKDDANACERNANECENMRTHANECERMRTDANAPTVSVNVPVSVPVTETVDVAVTEPPQPPQKPVAKYCNELGIPLTPYHCNEIMGYYEDGITDEMMCFAIDEAVAANVRQWKYAKTIIEGWITSGISTMDQVRHSQLEFKARKTKQAPAAQPQTRAEPERARPHEYL